MRRARPMSERLEADTCPEPTTGCLLWCAATNEHGYGRIMCGSRNVTGSRRMTLVHRIAWELEHGPIPAGLCVLHKCDTPACVNVDHLFLGTPADNVRDMMRKRRVGGWARRAFTREQVANVRQLAADGENRGSNRTPLDLT